MKVIGFLLATSLALASSADAHATEDPLAKLLSKLAQQADALETAFETASFQATSRIRELDDDGKVKSERRTIDRITRKDGKPSATLLEAIEDGEDVRAKIEKERADRKAKNEKDGKKRGEFPNPFRRENASEYHFERRESPPGSNTVRIAFEPRKPSKERFSGLAVIDAATHRLRSLTARPSKFPFGLDAMTLHVTFGDADTHPVVLGIDLRGKGGLPFMKKRFEVRLRFSGWRFPVEASQENFPPSR